MFLSLYSLNSNEYWGTVANVSNARGISYTNVKHSKGGCLFAAVVVVVCWFIRFYGVSVYDEYKVLQMKMMLLIDKFET